MSEQFPLVMSFAATDPSGGAGLQADLLTISSMGCHPLSVVTAITVQDTSGVDDVLPIDPEWVVDQARAMLEEVLADYPDIPLVLDPVLASGRGDELADEDMLDAMRELLIPQSTIITPNSMEARRLALDEDNEDDDPSLEECAKRLLQMGCEYVLITGTHEQTPNVINTLYGEHGVISSDSWARLPGIYHGSGCTLSAAIAALLAQGVDVPEAVKEAQEYTWQTLNAGFRPGMGQHIPDRLFWARGEEDEEQPERPN